MAGSGVLRSSEGMGKMPSGGHGWALAKAVDGRNPAPVDRCFIFIPLFIGFQPSKVVQDFFHPP